MRPFNAAIAVGLLGLAAETAAREPAMIVWEVNSLERIGGLPVTLVGKPSLEQTDRGPAVRFNGATDGLILGTNPVHGATAFTVEALIRPAAGGAFEQRFLHIHENKSENRLLLEIRQVDGADWYGDTYLQTGAESRFLNDPRRRHRADEWHALALVYDGKQMIQYEDGVRELQGAVAFAPLGPGQTALGMRFNKVHWFKGVILRVRFTPRALAATELLRP
jgi:hypothetical protein